MRLDQDEFMESSVDGAGKFILDILNCNDYRDKNIIYIHGWDGLGAVPLLRYIAQELSTKALPPELCYDKIIYLDCSAWESRRMMQRKIAEELKVDHTTMKVFDMQDEEDDFNGVDPRSRDVIQSFIALTYGILKDRRFMMIFINGSDEEIDLASFGIPVAKYLSNRVIWTFDRRLLTISDSSIIEEKSRDTQRLFCHDTYFRLSFSEFKTLLHEEAARIVTQHPCMEGIDLKIVTDCCLFTLFLHYSFHITTGFDWMAHASNYLVCASITEKDTKSEMVNALHKGIYWKCDAPKLEQLCERFMVHPEAPFLAFKNPMPNYQTRAYQWVCISSDYLTVQEEDMQTILERTSSLFIVFQRSNDPPVLPNGWFKHCSNLAVITLCFCSFSFLSPPFLGCQAIKFLGLEHCTDNKAAAGDNPTNWAHLQSLRVLDMRNTNWDAILTDEKLEIMDNLMELNIEGFICWQYISQLLQNRLPRLERLRIIKPTRRHQEAVPTDIKNSLFMDKKGLQILDLSGNRDLKALPTSIANASNLQVLVLDGCDELETVVLDSESSSSLRSFSFDGYGPTIQWKSMVDPPPESSRPKNRSSRDVKTLTISLQGCKQLENLFLRGLPHLEELDLSGSTIKILDFDSMLVDVPNLKRLYLLGCEHLRAIRWTRKRAAITWERRSLKLLCIDTRPGWSANHCARPSLDNSYKLQVHATIVDARLAKCLYNLIRWIEPPVYFNIQVTNSGVCGEKITQEEAACKGTIELRDQPNLVQEDLYGDVFQETEDASSSLMEAFPQPPGPESERHVEIAGDGSHNIQSEMEKIYGGLAELMTENAESLNVHDSSSISTFPSSISTFPGTWWTLRWCRVERCSNLDIIFPAGSSDYKGRLETIWASDLPMARGIWSTKRRPIEYSSSFRNLQHLHLRSCPRLQSALPVWLPSFRSLRTLHIIHCGDLVHVFALDHDERNPIINSVLFPKLTTIHLYDLPKLRQISECKEMVAPALKTIRIRGCPGLRRLPSLEGREPGVERPAVEMEKDVWDKLEWDGMDDDPDLFQPLPSLEGREPGMERPGVEMEKDVWDKLEWDGMDAGHDPKLFQPLVHSRHYRRRFLRGTVLR